MSLKVFNRYKGRTVSFTTGTRATRDRATEEILKRWPDRFALGPGSGSGKVWTQQLKYNFAVHGNCEADIRKKFQFVQDLFYTPFMEVKANIGTPDPRPEDCPRLRSCQPCRACTAALLLKQRGQHVPLGFTDRQLTGILGANE